MRSGSATVKPWLAFDSRQLNPNCVHVVSGDAIFGTFKYTSLSGSSQYGSRLLHKELTVGKN